MNDLTFSEQLVHNLLLRQIQSPVKSEMWFAVGGKTLRFSIQEFCLITGLECGLGPPVLSKEKGDGSGSFRSSMLNGEVRFNNKTLEAMFKAASLLYFLETVLFGKDQKVHIGAHHVELLEDLETFNKYPWGRKCYETTLNSLKRDLRRMSQEFGLLRQFLPLELRLLLNPVAHLKVSMEGTLADETEITIRPRGFNIVWGNDTRYWQLPEKNKETEVAELKQVSWLEITGSVDVKAGKTYAIEFQVSMKPDAFGWRGRPVFLMAKVGKKGKYIWKTITTLDEKRTSTAPFSIPGTNSQLTILVPNNANAPDNNKLFFGLYEVWSGKWKGGLLIHKAIIKEIK
ncbi:hypothetical protein LWI29_017900 [Acer saccharum]|uniref:DUF1985 domain-containing protein n=1 Tax=Acer saccharum TaxID=4024 RepID=A0AA39VHS4_ACESA|nr:hypothetical protein LWI29_017900 [Acer saccharum]